MRRKLKYKTVNTMLHIAVTSMVVCTIQQLYSSSNNSNTDSGNNLATGTSSSSEDMLSIMAVGDSIGYNIDSKRLYNLSQIYLQFRVLNLQKTILMENLEYGYLAYEYDRSFSVHKL